MANASLQPIYERLNGVNNYHPYSANTFADWSVEAGDIVTVKRGNESYASPAHSVSMNWKGQSKVVLESKGEKTRGSVAVMSAKSYTSGGGGGNSYRSSRSGGRRMQEQLAGVQEYAESVEIYAKTADGDLSSRINVSAGKIEQVVQAVGDNGKVTAASITLAINKAGSSARINADNIILDGTTTLNSIMSVDGQAVRINRRLVVGSGASMTQIYPSFISTPSVLCNNTAMKVADATVSGNTLTITYCDGRSPQTFSKATTLSGEWSGNITAGKSYKVTAKQNNIAVGNPHYSPALDGYYTGTKSWEDNYHTLSLPVTVYDENGTDLFRDTLSIDTSAAYSAGASSSSYSYHKTITYNRTEQLPSGTLRYHYYTTGEYIITSGTKTVYYN